MVDDGLEVAHEMRVGRAGGGVKGAVGDLVDGARDEDVSECNALADEEGVGRQVLVESVQGAGLAFVEEGVNLPYLKTR